MLYIKVLVKIKFPAGQKLKVASPTTVDPTIFRTTVAAEITVSPAVHPPPVSP